ncbi:MAG: AAA family ATPase [Bacillota bacterium]
MNENMNAINEAVKSRGEFLKRIKSQISRVIVGQEKLIDGLLIGLLTGGHVLLEGVPGLAKTLSVKSLAACIGAVFQRIQFTPDLLPADLVGTLIYNPQTGTFKTKKGPLFAQIVLADEINRAPAKVQSALLEAMEEKQVTIGDETHRLPEPFMVLATQNPIEQKGTYPLPEAQLDRFMLKLKLDYPVREEELAIMERMARTTRDIELKPATAPEEIMDIRKTVDQVYMDGKIKDYIVDLVLATRKPSKYGLDLDSYVEYGASPRATICLAMAAKAHAFIRGRGFVVPNDVKSIGADVLRHRIIVSYEAEADELGVDDLIGKIFDGVEVP